MRHLSRKISELVPSCAAKLVRVRCSTIAGFQHRQERRRPVEHVVEEVHPGSGCSCGAKAGEGGMIGGSELDLPNQSRVSFTKQNRSAIVFPSKPADEFQDQFHCQQRHHKGIGRVLHETMGIFRHSTILAHAEAHRSL